MRKTNHYSSHNDTSITIYLDSESTCQHLSSQDSPEESGQDRSCSRKHQGLSFMSGVDGMRMNIQWPTGPQIPGIWNIPNSLGRHGKRGQGASFFFLLYSFFIFVLNCWQNLRDVELMNHAERQQEAWSKFGQKYRVPIPSTHVLG